MRSVSQRMRLSCERCVSKEMPIREVYLRGDVHASGVLEETVR